MPLPQPLPSRLIGALFVERGLVSESQIRVALEIQQETGQQLGEVLVERFGVSRKELASVVAEQWAKLGGSSGPEDTASWRRLGEIFVERGFVSQEELDQALTRQRQTGERLGEALVAQGVISKFELAGALAEQMAALGEAESAEGSDGEQPAATVHHLPLPVDPGEIPFGALTDAEVEGPTDEPEPGVTEVVRLDLAARLGLVDARRDETDVEEGSGTAAEPPPEPTVADGVTEPVFEETTAEGNVGAGEAEVTADVGEPVGFEASTHEVWEPVHDEPTAEGDVETAFAEVTEDVGEPVGFEASTHDVWEVLDGPTAEGDVETAFAEVTEDVGKPVGIEAPADEGAEAAHMDASDDLPALRQRRLPTLAVDDAPEPATSLCVAYAPTPAGYRLVALGAVPQQGETIDVPDVGQRLVLRVGASPLPGDDRVCAFVEEPVLWAPLPGVVA